MKETDKKKGGALKTILWTIDYWHRTFCLTKEIDDPFKHTTLIYTEPSALSPQPYSRPTRHTRPTRPTCVYVYVCVCVSIYILLTIFPVFYVFDETRSIRLLFLRGWVLGGWGADAWRYGWWDHSISGWEIILFCFVSLG